MSESTEPAQPSPEGRRRHPLARGIGLLALMVDTDQETHGVRELAGRLGVSPSTVHRLVTDLESLGLASRTANGSYRLGLEFLRLAWTAADRFPMHEVAIDTLRELTEQSGESSFFGVYGEPRQEMMFTFTVESPHPLRYALPQHEWLPLHAGASGLAILAFLPEEVREEVLSRPLAATTGRTITDPVRLRERLERIRADGYSITHGERIEGAIAIAAPVFGPLGSVAGSTGLTLPDARFKDAHEASLTSLVREIADRLSGYMSGSRDPRTGILRRSAEFGDRVSD
ncbi:IclR family transcriptional regulator [Rathayibacter sp. VKM Ac-2835]|uniref:IclR family transcriptional regulator n=1 Tax=Rathayibacter sp. VKM Ac-2835 TaxID=2739043 RepID=UPI00265EE923|nr:IclR family transcriptional regulator [Rathayibacter sp. VKM Ac-2835]